ncbi:MAG: DNA polymerase III subunit alpha [Spirochaetales bacterium]|nr:DNA polymerase III subunit alpha [Spirochaetales bacterium]
MSHAAGFPLFFARSRFSLMTGAAEPAALCARAAAGAYGAVALADLDNLYALPEFVDAAADTGVKPLAAAWLGPAGRRTVAALALDRRGFSRLNRLLSRALSVDTVLRRFRLPPEAFDQDEGGSDRGGAEARAADTGSAGRARLGAAPWDPVADLASEGWEGLALASSEPGVLAALARAASDGAGGRGPGRQPFVLLEAGRPQAALARLGSELGLPPLAGSDARFFDPDDRERAELLEAIEARQTLAALRAATGRAAPGSECDFVDAAGLTGRLSAFPEALDNARALAEAAAPAGSFFSQTPVFPAWRGLPEAEARAALAAACREGVPRRYGAEGASRPDLVARLGRELRIIGDKGFAGYFLVVRDIVSRCPRTCGRGSAASSLVSYLLGITHVDPLEHDLFFERFLNEGRTDPPDIDVDFPWDERPALIRSVLAENPGRSALVADHCGFSGRSAIREPALALGIATDEIARLSREARLKGPGALPDELARLADLVRGTPRYIGTHPGGMIITGGPLEDYVHVQESPLGYPVIAWEKDGAERAGLVKIDLLGNRSLAVLRDGMELANRAWEAERPLRDADSDGAGRGGTARGSGPGGAGREGNGTGARAADAAPHDGTRYPLSWERFDPVDEASARALVERGDTVGVFYIESPATRRLLRKMGTADYRHLVVASSIIRPAANRFVDEYVARLHGKKWRRLSSAVEEALAETHGVMVYQEDVSRVAMAAAGFDAVEADALRKALTKKRKAPSLLRFRTRFMAGCAARGAREREARQLWEMMASFDGYSFCKAHSASYALVSYRLAWLKANRPAEFIVSVINNGGGFYGTSVYAGEARRMGLSLLPPDANRSEVLWTVERPEPGAGGEAALRIGFAQIRSAPRAFAEAVVASRSARGPFRGAIDFFDRTRPDRETARAWILSGCLDGLPLEPGGPRAARAHLLWAWHRWRSLGEGAGEALFPTWEAPAGLAEHGRRLALASEAETLGFVASSAPAELFAARARAAVSRLSLPPLVDSRALAGSLGRRVSIAGVAAARKEVVTKRRDAMCFATFEDSFGLFDAVLFPQAWTRLVPMLEEHDAVLVVGEPRAELGAVAVHVEDAFALDRPRRGA